MAAGESLIERRGNTAARWLAPAMVAVLTCVTFLPALRCGFVSWDDDRNIVDNAGFRGLDREHLGWMLTTFHGGHYQPLTWLSFAVDHRLWKLNPVGYHLTNVVLHAVCAVLFYLLALRLLILATRGGGGLAEPAGIECWSAAMAALVFALHPLRVESVVWVTERRDVLSGVFFLACLLAYVRAVGRRAAVWHVLAWGMMVLSLSAKAIGLTLPLVMLVLDVYPLRRLAGAKSRAGRLILEKIPYVALSISAGVLAVQAQRSAGAWREVATFGVLERFVTASYGLGFYIIKWVAPFGLSPLYPLPARDALLSGGYVVIVPLVLAMFVVVAALRRRAPWLAAAVVAYAVLLVPVSGAAQSGKHLAADRYSYLALLPFAVLVGAGVLQIARRAHWQYARIASCVIVVALSVTTIRQCRVWRDSRSLWQHVVNRYPQSHVARVGLGNALLDDGEPMDAVEQFRAAVTAKPDDAKAHNGLGRASVESGDPRTALAAFTRAVELAPDDAGYHRNLGYVLAGFGQLGAALAEYRAAIAIDPADAQATGMLAALLQKCGRFAEAREALELGLHHAPQDTALAGSLAWLLATCPQNDVRDGSRAVELAWQLAERTDYGDPWALETLAAALAETGDFARAVSTVDVALKLVGGEVELAARLRREREAYAADLAYRDPAMLSGER